MDQKVDAQAIRIQDEAYNGIVRIIDFLRPNLSTKVDAASAPKTLLINGAIAIHDPSSLLIDTPESSANNFGKFGAGQA